MQNSAKQVEGMVRMKMEQREYIILCLEDTNDWSNATTRRLVMQVPAVLLVIYIAAAVKQGTFCVSGQRHAYQSAYKSCSSIVIQDAHICCIMGCTSFCSLS